MKKILNISLFTIFTIALIGLMGFIYMEQGKQEINDVIIKINKKENSGFISEETIQNLIADFDSISYQQAKQVNTRSIEKLITTNPFVEDVDVYVNIDKDLVINIEEKKALIRIFTADNSSFYIDREGTILPTSNQYSPHVLIASGFINIVPDYTKPSIFDTVYNNSYLTEIYELAHLINQSKFLTAQIGQIYLNSKNEIDLVPLVGKHLVKFGTLEDASQKLVNLELFYKKALLGEGWDSFEIINLKYKNQVVCKRKKAT